MLVLFTDSDSDVTPAIAEKYGYKIISMPYAIGDQTVYPYKDFQVFDAKSFYDRLRAGEMPSMFALNPDDYVSEFEPVFANGDDILYVHFSRAMSGTFDFMDKALADLKVKYPERKFYSIDTKGISIESLIIAEEVGQMHKDGKSIEEIMKWAETEVDKFAVYFFADDLKFFRRSGRVKGLAAIMGSILKVCPIINMAEDGIMKSVGKEMGRLKSMQRLVQYVVDLGDDVKGHNVIIAHSDSLEIAEKLASMLREKFGDDLKIEFSEVNPTAGCHCGPDAIGVSFHSIHR